MYFEYHHGLAHNSHDHDDKKFSIIYSLSLLFALLLWRIGPRLINGKLLLLYRPEGRDFDDCVYTYVCVCVSLLGRRRVVKQYESYSAMFCFGETIRELILLIMPAIRSLVSSRSESPSSPAFVSSWQSPAAGCFPSYSHFLSLLYQEKKQRLNFPVAR